MNMKIRVWNDVDQMTKTNFLFSKKNTCLFVEAMKCKQCSPAYNHFEIYNAVFFSQVKKSNRMKLMRRYKPIEIPNHLMHICNQRFKGEE